MCKEEYKGNPLHRYLKNKLNAFLFACSNCDEGSKAPMRYDRLIHH